MGRDQTSKVKCWWVCTGCKNRLYRTITNSAACPKCGGQMQKYSKAEIGTGGLAVIDAFDKHDQRKRFL